jgi:hypothetical protein
VSVPAQVPCAPFVLPDVSFRIAGCGQAFTGFLRICRDITSFSPSFNFFLLGVSYH